MRTLFCFALIALISGCTTMEAGLKAGFDMAWSVAEKSIEGKFPILEGKAMAYAKEAADKALDAACKFAAEKTVEVGNAAADKAMKNFKIDLDDCNGYADLLKKIEEENQRRKEAGEDPITTWGTLGLLTLLSVFQFGKSGFRVLKKPTGQPNQ